MTPRAKRTFLIPIIVHAVLCTGCATSRAAAAAPSMAAPAMASRSAEEAPSAAAAENGFSDVNTDKSLNTASYVQAWAEELLVTASRFRRELYRLQGQVISERIDYEDPLRARPVKLPQRAPKKERRQAIFEVSIPIESLPEMLDWLRMHSIIVEQYVVATRDGAMPAPATVAAQAQQQQQVAERLAEIEQRLAATLEDPERQELVAERAALQSALQQLRAQAAASLPAIRMATLYVRFEADQPQVRFAAAWIVPGARASMLVTDVLEQHGAREARVGAAISVGLPSRGRGGLMPAPLLELAGYPATVERSAGVSVTVGGSMYARSLGDGERVWLNPFAGMRLGYANLGEHAFVVAGEIGLEIMKTSGIAWSASVRPQGLLGSTSQVALEGGTTLSLAF